MRLPKPIYDNSLTVTAFNYRHKNKNMNLPKGYVTLPHEEFAPIEAEDKLPLHYFSGTEEPASAELKEFSPGDEVYWYDLKENAVKVAVIPQQRTSKCVWHSCEMVKLVIDLEKEDEDPVVLGKIVTKKGQSASPGTPEEKAMTFSELIDFAKKKVFGKKEEAKK